METGKRLIDANALLTEVVKAQALEPNKAVAKIIMLITEAEKVDAVSLEQYYELRENFIDYVCCGVTNPAPFCKNRCAECVNNYGWCKSNDKCRGFNPDGERKNE